MIANVHVFEALESALTIETINVAAVMMRDGGSRHSDPSRASDTMIDFANACLAATLNPQPGLAEFLAEDLAFWRGHECGVVSKCATCNGYGSTECVCSDCADEYDRDCEDCGGAGEAICEPYDHMFAAEGTHRPARLVTAAGADFNARVIAWAVARVWPETPELFAATVPGLNPEMPVALCVGMIASGHAIVAVAAPVLEQPAGTPRFRIGGE